MKKISFRKDYNQDKDVYTPLLIVNKTPAHPMVFFHEWYQIADYYKNNEEIQVMTLSTVNKKQQPKSRIVLLREFSKTGLIFYTNYESDKAKEIENNPTVAVNFYWDFINRQIRLEGKVQKISNIKSDKYFASRPLLSKIGAVLSKQSRILLNQEKFLQTVKQYKKNLLPKNNKNPIISRPQYWGGYLIKPHYFEFWLGKKNRIHERLVYYRYSPSNNKVSWKKKILYP
jgi:pyridoxamine 5'-phosphate oxidase